MGGGMGTLQEIERSKRWSWEPIILCVDDESEILRAGRRTFRDEPYEVITAGSAEEAIGWLEELPVDLVITDHLMPGMSGMDLLRVIHKRFPKPPVVFLTAYRTPSMVLRGIRGGADIFLSKPW